MKRKFKKKKEKKRESRRRGDFIYVRMSYRLRRWSGTTLRHGAFCGRCCESEMTCRL